jgi:hypothetical protein
MRRAARMNVNGRCFAASPARTKSPRCAGVIEMNVTEKNVTNVFQLNAGLAQIGDHIVESRFRAGIKQGNAVVGLKRGCGNDSGASKLSRI